MMLSWYQVSLPQSSPVRTKNAWSLSVESVNKWFLSVESVVQSTDFLPFSPPVESGSAAPALARGDWKTTQWGEAATAPLVDSGVRSRSPFETTAPPSPPPTFRPGCRTKLTRRGGLVVSEVKLPGPALSGWGRGRGTLLLAKGIVPRPCAR